MGIFTGVAPQLQRLSEGEMPDTVTIHTPGAATANAGGAMVPGSPTDSTTKGRIQPLDLKDLEGIVGGETRTEGWQALFIPRAVAVVGSDTVTVVSARHGTTTDYTIEQVVPLQSFGVHRKLVVRPT
jgi:hypothetical protein